MNYIFINDLFTTVGQWNQSWDLQWTLREDRKSGVMVNHWFRSDKIRFTEYFDRSKNGPKSMEDVLPLRNRGSIECRYCNEWFILISILEKSLRIQRSYYLYREVYRIKTNGQIRVINK